MKRSTASDELLMARAVDIARQHMQAGEGGPFGALIVDDSGRIVADGWNRVTSSHDPTAHAEVVAIRRACEVLGRHNLTGHRLITTCEPCPMCLAAAWWARVDGIIFAADRHAAARGGFDDADLYEEMQRPLPARHLRCERIDHPQAETLFDEWLAKPDRIPY